MKNDLIIDKIKAKKILLNNVKNRFLPLSESVSRGLEPEPNIQDFEFKNQLGSGSFGRVYLMTHKKTHINYALKVIDKKNKTNIEGKPYFRREIEIMYKIRHPNCVRLYGNFEDDNNCYFIMEYIPNGNLYNLLTSNRITGINIYIVASIMRQLISAIYYLHNLNPPIIHRDIKPENILLTNNLNVKLTDFGWSNYIDYEGEQRSTICGTPIYLAPEMIQGIGHDEHVDIWCLGVLLFELLTGTQPFIGQNRNLLLDNIIKVNIVWPTPPKLPMDPDAKDLISKILKKKPKERISLENMVKHNFFLKYCPNVKPILCKKQRYYLKPFVVSKDVPKEDYYDYDEDKENNNIRYEKIHHLRNIYHLPNKKSKSRDITPSPPGTKICLEKYTKLNNIDLNSKLLRQNTSKIKVLNNLKKLDKAKNDDYDTINTFGLLRDVMKENDKLEKEIENYKLREIGYNQKIEQLIFALNNLNQENMLLKMEIEKKRKELEKSKKDINILLSNHKLNVNLNNQTTVNISTSNNSNIFNSKSNYYKGLNNKNSNTIMRTFISKTPEGLQRRKVKKIILNKNSNMKPYLKKNALLNKSNKSIFNDEELNNSNSNYNSNKIKKKESVSIDLSKLNKKLKKNISTNDLIKGKKKTLRNFNDSQEKETYKERIKKLQKENEALKAENQKMKIDNYKSMSKVSSQFN